MIKINLKRKKLTSATLFLTFRESPVSEGCYPVWAHLQCPGKQGFQCSPSRYLRGDQDCSLIFLQVWGQAETVSKSSWLDEPTKVVFVVDGLVWRFWLYLWSHWGGRLWGSGAPPLDQTHQAWLSLPAQQPGHSLQTHINELLRSGFASCCFTTAISSPEGILRLYWPLTGWEAAQTAGVAHLQRRRGRYPGTPPLWSGPSLCLWCPSAQRTCRPL